jgi:hypothetical protein
VEFVPDLELAVDAARACVDASDLGEQGSIAPGSRGRWSYASRPIGARRDLDLPTERLDPEAVTVRIDERAHLGLQNNGLK